MSRRPPESPRIARWLMARLLPREEREFVIGDLEEAFASRVQEGCAARRAREWYWRAALGAILALAIRDRSEIGVSMPDAAAKGDGVMKNLLQDARYGLRLLVTRPAFTTLAVLTLALGIGANTAVFSVAHTLLIKALPYPDSERLVLVLENNLSRGWTQFSVAPANFLDWRERTRSFEEIAAWGGATFNYTGGETPERLRALSGTTGFLEMLGGTPALGRGFRADEFEPGREFVVILNHGFWQREFGGSPGVLDRAITLNGQSYQVVGVMRPNWTFGGREIDLFVPRTFTEGQRQARGAHFLSTLARLRSGVTPEQAQLDMSHLAVQLEQQYPGTNKGWGAVVTPLREAAVGSFRPMLLILLSAVAMVLLIACANVANMLLARATVRAREIAIRRAIGAGRLRIVQQLLTESVLLALAGGILGVALAHWTLKSLIAAYPDLLPRSSAIGVDGAVLAFTAGLAITAAVVFGAMPAFAAAGSSLSDSLKEGVRGGGGSASRRFLRNSLVVAEVALALVLLAGAGLLLKSYARLASVEPGFETAQRISVTTVLPQPKYAAPERVVAFYRQALERLGALPGVEHAALTSIVPLSGNDEIYGIVFEGRPPLPPGEGVSALYYLVGPTYFATMGIPLLKGRLFTDLDRDGAPRVAIINDTFAKMHFPGEDPIGRRIRMGRNSDIVREIVGVVGSVKHYGLGEKALAQMYEPFDQFPKTGMSFVLKASIDPAALAPSVRREIQAVDPDQPVASMSTLTQLLADSVTMPRVQTTVLGAFAGIALLLAAVGLYGVMSYVVSQRSQEIGIRMALGARSASVVRLVLRQALVLTGAGLAMGIVTALFLGRALSHWLEPVLFEVSPHDVGTLAIVGLVLCVVSLLAAFVPAQRAVRVDPVQALRAE